MDQARREAIDQMAAQCAVLSGHGVVGVRLTSSVTSSFTSEYLECTAIGTAARAPGAPSLDHPFTAAVAGTAITRFALPAQPAGLPALTIMPLGDRRPGVPSGGGTFGAGPRA
jgi:hypothetical protein